MYVIFVNETRRNKPVILPLSRCIIRVHHEGGHHIRRLERVKTDDGGDANEDIGEIQWKFDYVSIANIRNFISPEDGLIEFYVQDPKVLRWEFRLVS